MAENRWDNFGEQIKNTVDHAIREGDFTNLSRSIGDIINNTVDSVKDTVKGTVNSSRSRQAQGPYPLKGAYQESIRRKYNRPQSGNTAPALYQQAPQGRVAGILMAVTGYSGVVVFGIFLMVFLIFFLFGVGLFVLPVGTIVFGILTAASLILGIFGSRKLGFVSRFRGYVRLAGRQMYVPVQMLAEKTGKSLSYVTGDLKKMIDSRLFLQGHLDEENHCLILSDQAYQEYIAAKTEYQARERAAAQEKQARDRLSPECRKLIEEGEAYIRHIHWCNEQIPGEEISAKLDQMERVVTRIFDVVREHPEVEPELGKLMSYYLPTTRKLLDTYRELDHQPVAGENISSIKSEIEATIDTLNVAFEKFLDDLYEDKAWDISSDISVLNTILAQDGLKDDQLKSGK